MSVVAVVTAALAGGLAAMVRWGVSLAFARQSLPWAVLIVNVVASAIGGGVLGLAAVGSIDSGIRLVLLSGIAGGLSTFSTWSVETMQLVQARRRLAAVGSVAANLLLGVSAATAGYVAIVAALS